MALAFSYILFIFMYASISNGYPDQSFTVQLAEMSEIGRLPPVELLLICQYVSMSYHVLVTEPNVMLCAK